MAITCACAASVLGSGLTGERGGEVCGLVLPTGGSSSDCTKVDDRLGLWEVTSFWQARPVGGK